MITNISKYVLNKGEYDRIGDDIILMYSPYNKDGYDCPFRSDMLSFALIMGGGLECKIDLIDYKANTPGGLIILPAMIVERIRFSDDFKGIFLLISRKILSGLELDNSFSLITSIAESPFIALDSETIDALKNYLSMIRGIIRQEDNPHRIEMIRLLTKAYNYGIGYYIHKRKRTDSVEAKSRKEQIVRQFLSLAKENCKKERGLDFYAARLCLSAKYLTTVIKDVTGKPAGKWIEEYTILNAKILLQEGRMTIGQISDELSFASQSDFGKYFKKAVGLSPKHFSMSL